MKRWKEKDEGRKETEKRGREEGDILRDGRKKRKGGRRKMKGGRRQTKRWKERMMGGRKI